MPTYTQAPHRIEIRTPLGHDALYLIAIDGHEEYSRLFHYSLEMFSDLEDIQPADIVGKNVSLVVKFPDDSQRFFNGHMQRFTHIGVGDRGTQYRGEVVPWLWFLTKTADCRIFQEKDVKEIITKIFDDLGFSDYEFKLQGHHPKHEYCVQYRETDFNFVCRLMEEEGIFFFFRHEEGKHTLVMADHAGAYVDGGEKAKYFGDERAGDVRNENVMGWEHRYEYRTGKWAHTDYNFEKPNNSLDPTCNILMGTTNTVINLEKNKNFEIYDYPGTYKEKADSEKFVKVRMEDDEAPYDVVTGTGICRSFNPGTKFKVDHHRAKHEEGKQYVITSISHTARIGAYVTGGGAAESTYTNSFTCVPDKVVIRPARLSPKPVINGSQTAVVTGPHGEEIWPDKYGRVKVQFHWDREGKMDDKSSCWIRVAQPGAGRGWGMMSIPRVGQEVVITFLEGDPDRPLVTGVVYNAGQMPSRKLPDEKTKCYIKSNTSTGGEGHNEIMFEDKKDKEMVYVHGEKDVNIRCKNNYHEIVGYEKEDGSKRLLVHQDNEAIIKGSEFKTIEGSRKQLIVENSEEVIKGEKKELIHLDNGLHIKGAHKEKVDGDWNLTVGGKKQVKVGTNYALESGQEIHMKAGMKCVIEAGMQLTIKGPGGFIDIGPTGISIVGTLVNINSGGSPGTGSGSSPAEPSDPEEVSPTEPNMDGYSETGQKSCPS
jgi:type VI secretion system secreted protein VgrG